MTASPTVELDLRDLRVAGGIMLVGGLLLPAGHGLGLPCGFRGLTGLPCPLCGLTGSVTSTLHLHLTDAFGRNPAGPILVVAALVLLAAGRRPRVAVPVWLPAAGLLVLWACALSRPH